MPTSLVWTNLGMNMRNEVKHMFFVGINETQLRVCVVLWIILYIRNCHIYFQDNCLSIFYSLKKVKSLARCPKYTFWSAYPSHGKWLASEYVSTWNLAEDMESERGHYPYYIAQWADNHVLFGANIWYPETQHFQLLKTVPDSGISCSVLKLNWKPIRIMRSDMLVLNIPV